LEVLWIVTQAVKVTASSSLFLWWI